MKRIPLLYLSSYALSLLGNSIAAVVLPLVVLQTTGNIMSTGIVALATTLPAFVVGLAAGVVIDKVNRRTSSIVTDIISAVSIVALPLVDLLTGLNLGWFILFGLIGSFGDIPGLTAREALLPAIARKSAMASERLIGMRESVGALVVVLGPAIAGSLMTILDGSAALWITAITSFAAAILTLCLPKVIGEIPVKETQTTSTKGWKQLKEGWHALFVSNPFLLAVTLLNLIMITIVAGLQGILLPVHFLQLGQAEMVGYALTSLALGTLLGSGVYAIFGVKGHRRAWFVVGMIGTVLGIGTISLLPASEGIFAGAFGLGAGSGLFGSLLGVLMLERIPEYMRGRIMGTQNSLAMLSAPIGIFVIALIAQEWSLGVAGMTIGVLWLVTATVALLAPMLRDLEPKKRSEYEE